MAKPTYTIQKGDTASGIASKNNMSLSQFLALNPSIKDPNKIFAGATVNLGSSTPAKSSSVTSYLTGSGTGNSNSNGSLADNPALAGGASGRFLDLTPEEADARAKADEQILNNTPNTFAERMPGETDSAFADRIRNQPFYLAGGGDSNMKVPTVGYDEAKGILSSLGLSGTGFSPNFLVGLTAGDAKRLAEEKAGQLKKDISQNTSYAYNSDYLNAGSSAKKILNDYQLTLKDSVNDPWKTGQDKTDAQNKLLEDTTTKFSELFKTPDQFDTLYKTSPDFKSVIDTYTSNGGSMDAIKAKLSQNQPPMDTYSTTKLSTGNPLVDKLLDPQTKTAESNIAYLQSIPEQYRNLYFGDEGYFTKIRKDAEDSVSQLNEAYKNVQKSTLEDLDAQAKINEQKANAELATIEENRATNKNYLTGMLAKLGALTTSGEAPASLSKLDAKYDKMASDTRTALTTAQSNLATQKAKAIATLEQDRLSKVSAIKSDLSKSSFEIQKELMGVEQNTRKEINSIIGDWQKQATAINKSFIDKANANKTQYENLYFKIVSGGLSQKFLQDLKKDQKLTPTEATTYGVPYGTTYGQIEGKTLKNSAKPVTQDQSNNATYAQRALDAEKIFSGGGDKVMASISPTQFSQLQYALGTGNGGFLDTLTRSTLAKYGISDALKEQFQAQRSFINSVLRKESGAAISMGEFDNGVKQYFPQPGDSKDLIAQKKLNRQRAVQGMITSAGSAWDTYQNTDIPSGYGFDTTGGSKAGAGSNNNDPFGW